MKRRGAFLHVGSRHDQVSQITTLPRNDILGISAFAGSFPKQVVRDIHDEHDEVAKACLLKRLATCVHVVCHT